MSSQYPKQDKKLRYLYRHLFNQLMPRGWKFTWGSKAVTIHAGLYTNEIVFFQVSVSEDIPTAVHELVHVRYPDMEHGTAFSEMVAYLTRKAITILGAKGL